MAMFEAIQRQKFAANDEKLWREEFFFFLGKMMKTGGKISMEIMIS